MPDQLFFDIVKMVVALACIVGLIFGVVFILKRFMPGAVRAGGERMGIQVLAQLSMGTRQRVCVIRVQDRTLVVGVTEGSINTLAELDAPAAQAQKEADDPKIFSDLLAWRKDSETAPLAAAAVAGSAPVAKSAAEPLVAGDPGDGPRLFAPPKRS